MPPTFDARKLLRPGSSRLASNQLTGETAGQRKGAKSHGTEVINEEYTRMTNL
jgi:hypothetical protein